MKYFKKYLVYYQKLGCKALPKTIEAINKEDAKKNLVYWLSLRGYKESDYKITKVVNHPLYK